MAKQEQQTTLTIRPTTDDPDEWNDYWQAQGIPWRTEPEITADRQTYLVERRHIIPNIEHGIYPFKDVEPKLTRADVEWLLTTHESDNLIGPVDLTNAEQENREGLDLRGADLSGLDLSALPLARLIGGLELNIFPDATREQRAVAAVSLERARLWSTQLQQADLSAARIQEALMLHADLEGAYLDEARLEKAELTSANLTSAVFWRASLTDAKLDNVTAISTDFGKANLQGASFNRAVLDRATFKDSQAHTANFEKAELRGANLAGAKFAQARFALAHLEGADLEEAFLAGAIISEAFFDATTKLNSITLYDQAYGVALLQDVHWGGVNIAVIRWEEVPADAATPPVAAWRRLHKPLQEKMSQSDIRSFELSLWEGALRTNRQIAVVLRDQGLNEDADRFAYRAQCWRRVVLWKRRKYGAAMWATFLEGLAGYGYRPQNTAIWYTVIIASFAFAYFHLGPIVGAPLSPLGSIVFSVTSFHGRGFFPGGSPGHSISLDDPLIVLAASEAIVGLILEVSFIATFTQRFFGK